MTVDLFIAGLIGVTLVALLIVALTSDIPSDSGAQDQGDDQNSDTKTRKNGRR